MPFITVRSIGPGLNHAGEPTLGHAWIEISGSNVLPVGQVESFGYYPEGDPFIFCCIQSVINFLSPLYIFQTLLP